MFYLSGCLATITGPQIVRTTDLIPLQSSYQTTKIVFPVTYDRFLDVRSNRNVLGHYDTFGGGGTVTIAPDRDISEVFETIVMRAFERKGIHSGSSIFILKGTIQRANVGAVPASKSMNADLILELTLVNSNTGARLWQKSYHGIATGISPQDTLALAFQDISASIDKDDSILGLKQTFLASGGKLPEAAERKEPEVKKQVVDIHNIPDFKITPLINDLAVIIGIENYQGLPKSDFSKSDAEIVKDYLKALGFKERNIEFITNERATKSSIEKSLEAWLPNRVKKDSRVFVYYSGHGAPDPQTGEAYLVPYDGDPGYLNVTGYPLKRLYENLGKLQVAEVIVLLDSCFSGAGGRSVIAKGARPLVMMADIKAIPSNMAILSATQGTQISTSSTEKGHGVFTYYFLKALKEGKKTIAEIYEYIKPLVEDEAKQLNVQQSPSISPDIEKLKGRFILRR
jgi:hypothetical protein